MCHRRNCLHTLPHIVQTLGSHKQHPSQLGAASSDIFVAPVQLVRRSKCRASGHPRYRNRGPRSTFCRAHVSLLQKTTSERRWASAIHIWSEDPPFYLGYGYRRGFGIVRYFIPLQAWHASQSRFGCIYARTNCGVSEPLAASPVAAVCAAALNNLWTPSTL